MAETLKPTVKLVPVERDGVVIPGLFTFGHIERDPVLEKEFYDFVKEQEKQKEPKK